MKRTSTSVGKRRLELSNLSKVLFPGDGIVKAELIEYYHKTAPTILRHIKGRPLSLVRYPDGIEGETFFQKNKPDWTPDWVQNSKLDESSRIRYVVATEPATLVWLANLACIELHQVQSRLPRLDKPDIMVFDLDPPEGYPFASLIELARALREHIESFGYHTFAKTTGGKGIHLVVPIEPKWGVERVFEAVSAVAKSFVSAHRGETTLHIKKEAREGKVLIDIYRLSISTERSGAGGQGLVRRGRPNGTRRNCGEG